MVNLQETLVCPKVKGIVYFYSDVTDGGADASGKYETEFMDIEDFISLYPRSVILSDGTKHDMLLFGIDEQYRDQDKHEIVFKEEGSGEEIHYDDDPRLMT